MKDMILGKLNKEKISGFYNGPIYPAVIAATVALGSITGAEIYLCLLNCAFIVGALISCNTLKPLIINLCTFVYQISVDNAPFYPSYSNYFSSGWRLPVLIILAVVLVLCIVYFALKNKIYKGLSFKKTPLLLPLLVLSSALLTNGIFSWAWVYKNLVYALAQIATLFFVFILFYQGLKNEKADGLASYFAYISMLMALIISAQVLHLYLTSDSVFVDGSINKVGVQLGWGIWNLVGISAVVLIPMNFYGVAKNKYPWLYFSVATLIYIVAILTLSRNALIFGTASYGACVLIFSFIGERKKIFRTVTLVGLGVAVILAIVFFDKIYALFKDYFDRGFSDNGRFALWEASFFNFLEAPVFGKGFYGLGAVTDTFGPMPESAHNTVFQLMSAGGIVSLAAYGYYRYKTALPFIKRPCLMKAMLAISVISVVLGSLLDNFIFDIYPTFYMNVALIIAFKKSEEQNGA